MGIEESRKRRDFEVVDGVHRPVGYEQVTSLSSAASLTPPTLNGVKARIALIVAETQNVRWRDDGTNPSTTVGIPLAKDFPFWYNGDLTAIKFIEVTASAKLNVSYYA